MLARSETELAARGIDPRDASPARPGCGASGPDGRVRITGLGPGLHDFLLAAKGRASARVVVAARPGDVVLPVRLAAQPAKKKEAPTSR